MSERICDNCGHKKPVLGAKTCEKGHFICKNCAYDHKHCPLCTHTLK
jgi:hypothetical protein